MLKYLGNVRYQIALILSLAILPLASLAVFLSVDEGRKDAAQAQADSRQTVRLITRDLNRVIQSSSDLVQGFSRYSVIRDHSESCNAQLASLKPAFPQFANMVVIDTDSRVLCAASNPMHLRTLQNFPERLALMERVRRTRQVAVGSFVVTAPGKRVVPIWGPITDQNGQIQSFFSVTVDLDWLDEQINGVPLPPQAELLVIDSGGREIARKPEAPDWAAGTPAPTFERALVGKGDFEGEVTGDDGIGRFYSVARVRGGEDLWVVMKIPSSEIYGPARRRLALHLSGLASVGLLVLGLTWFGSDRYFRCPLAKLIKTANRLAAGNLNARTGLKYGGEIGLLAQSFDQMADNLERAHAERARMEEELREKERRLEEAQQVASLGSFTGEITGQMEWSDELYRIYEMDPAKDVPSIGVVLARSHPDDRALIEKTRENLTRQRGRFEFEHRLLMPDGRVKHVLVKGNVNSGVNDSPIIRGAVQDITERKRAEQEKARLEAQLHQAHKMESVGRLAGGVAHDFNNLLTVINGYSDVLMRHPENAQKYAQEIHKAGESAASLTRQLLAFSRMEATHLEPVLLKAIVGESRDMLERLMGVQIRMETSLQASPDEVLADPSQMQQCLMNLVLNARDAMPAGGLMTIRTANVEVTQDDIPVGSSATPGPHVRLTVKDTGVGMDEETRLRIFEPFFTTKEKGSGTGLGLSMVYGIVSQWQGFLKVGTEPGKGSEFSIYLPLNRNLLQREIAPAAKSGRPSTASATVLVVDDHDMVRTFVIESLRTFGYCVLEARNGVEALRLIDEKGAGIDLMLTDIIMPVMGGKELAARANTLCPSIRVLFMTGFAEASTTGAEVPDEVIMKPFGPEALEMRVRGLLSPRNWPVLEATRGVISK